MKQFSILLPALFLLNFFSFSQDTISYPHCNCLDIIDVLEPNPDGNYRKVCENVIIEKGEFKNGLKTGEWNSYSSDGTLIKTINYAKGTLDGSLSLFYNNGKKKLSGDFSKGRKNGDWLFYNQKEKLQWTLTYQLGTPVGKSLVYNRKGKKVVVSYDFDQNKYDINSPDFSLFEESAEVLQDPISGGWFILFLTDPTSKTSELGLDQNNIESELFLSTIEIPREFFDIYLNVNYNIKLSFKENGVQSIDLKRESAKGDEYPMFTFAVMTNDPVDLHKIKPSEFSLNMLDSKIEEAFSIFTPWQQNEGEFNMAFIYVINEIAGRESIDKP